MLKPKQFLALEEFYLNCFGLSKKMVYENEEFNLIQAALNIEEDMDSLRYNKIILPQMQMWMVCILGYYC